MLSVNNIHVKIASYTILSSLSLTIPQGAIVGLVGHNGAGKTTTLRSVMGLLRLESGDITFNNKQITTWAPQDRARRGIGYMPEDRRLVPGLTVEENILLPTWALKPTNAKKRLHDVYDLVPELKELARRTAGQLSGGQQKLVALARSFMVGHSLLLLDEPFEGVSPALSRRLADVVRGFQTEGISVLVAESDPNRV